MLAILMQFLGPPHSGSFICNVNLWLPSFLQKLQYETYFSLQRKIAILIAILLQRKSHLDSRHFGAVTFSIGKCTIKAQSVQRRIHCTKKPDGKRYTGYSFWYRLRNFLHKFTWIVLSVHKLKKLGKFWFMDNCWISCQVMADMKKVYNALLMIELPCPKIW